MASIVIRRLEEITKKQLRVRAPQHGGSMEEEGAGDPEVGAVALGANRKQSGAIHTAAVRRGWRGGIAGGAASADTAAAEARHPDLAP